MHLKYIPDPTKFPVFATLANRGPSLIGAFEEWNGKAVEMLYDAIKEATERGALSFWNAGTHEAIDVLYPGKGFDDIGIYDIPSMPPFQYTWAEYRWSGERFGAMFMQHESDDGYVFVVTLFQYHNGMAILDPLPVALTFKEDGVLTRFAFVKETLAYAAPGEDTKESAVAVIGSILIGFMFSHCKNVEIAEVLPRRQARRSMQRKGIGVARHHEVSILQSHTVTRGGSAAGRNEKDRPTKALHMARGHFATYSEDAPLFGRYTGTFWRPAHVRGNADNGTVYKDYKVKSPKE